MSEADKVDCVEHVWVFTGAVLGRDGAHLEHECTRCGSTAFEGPEDRFRKTPGLTPG